MTLPKCINRGEEIADGAWACLHPGILAPKGVTESACIKCAKVAVHCNKKPLERHLRLLEKKPLKVRIKKPVPCQHRGAEIDKVQCDTCAGKVMVKVFECNVHGQCTLAKPVLVDGKHSPVCEGCKHQLPPALPVRLDGNRNVE